MAKLGEGDPRWIVSAREDGTNVNNWHWTEKDVLPWSKARLGELFAGLLLLEGPGQRRVATTGLQALEGDALLNVRKAKLIASYELKVTVSWAGTTEDGRPGSGLIELPYVADENHDEDPELRVVLPEESTAAAALKAAILADGRAPVYKAIRTYVDELRGGVPSKSSSSSKADAPAAGAAAPAAAGGAAAAGAAASGSAAAKPATSAKAKCRRSLKLTERFHARPADIYECFTVAARLMAASRSPAVIEPVAGGAFSWFGGSVTGSFEELVPPQRLVLRWRFSSWEEGVTSQVVMELLETEPGNTLLTLSQTGLPEEDKFGNSDVLAQVESGWKEQVFGRIRAVFGFGV